MADNNATGVSAAFEILLEEMETEVEMANQVGSRAFERSDYARAREVANRAEWLQGLQDRLSTLHNEWRGQAIEYTSKEEEEAGEVSERRNFGRLASGLRTPTNVFHLPMLKIIQELGGVAKAQDVADHIEPMMRDVLTEADYSTLPSNPELERWRHSTYWARWRLVKDGLLKDGSPRGVWEISDKGRQFLAEQGG